MLLDDLNVFLCDVYMYIHIHRLNCCCKTRGTGTQASTTQRHSQTVTKIPNFSSRSKTQFGHSLFSQADCFFILGNVHTVSRVHCKAFLAFLVTFPDRAGNYIQCLLLNRLCLSALHYNENADRMQAMTLDGRPCYSIRFPKAKKEGPAVRQVKTEPTYGRIKSIIKKINNK